MKKKKGFTYAARETERDQELLVQKPTRKTEFEVQATLWAELRSLGIEVHGECKARFAGRAYVRFDLAIFDKGQLIAIIEVKRKERAEGVEGWMKTRQGNRYSQFNVPVVNVFGEAQASQLIDDVRAGRLPW